MSYKPKIADPTQLKWPCVDINEEKIVLNALENAFSKYKSCLRTIKKHPKWKKVKEEKEDRLTEEEGIQLKMFKSWFVVGAQTVMKKLERNSLSAVILWREMQPAVLRQALLQLISQHGCPTVCVTDLLSPLQQSWPGLTSATALGILKTEESNDFEELVETIKMNAPKVADSSVRELNLSEQRLAVPDNTIEATQLQTASIESSLRNGVCRENVCRPIVDAKRFYIYKDENKSKSFSGQSFIAFDESTPFLVDETIKGVRVQKEMGKRENLAVFGIRPSLGAACTSGRSYVTFTDETSTSNRKRKVMESETAVQSGYKRINVKKLQKNMQKTKKIKKKKK